MSIFSDTFETVVERGEYLELGEFVMSYAYLIYEAIRKAEHPTIFHKGQRVVRADGRQGFVVEDSDPDGESYVLFDQNTTWTIYRTSELTLILG